jgi:hypothetical protein
VTAAHLSDIAPTIKLVEARSRPGSAILADRYEYAYLARRRAAQHYFWNVGVLLPASALERRLDQARMVVLSYGASSGYPAGFIRFLDARFPKVRTRANTVWVVGKRQ